MKLKKKLFQSIDRTARAALAVSLAALTTVSVWAGYTAYIQSKANTRPTLLFRCMDFKLVEDGTVQALVRMSVENMSTFSGAGFNIEFNPYYMQPSFLNDTKTKQTLVDGDNKSDNKHFEEDQALKTVKFPTATAGTPVLPFATAVDSTDNFKRNEVVPGKIENGTITNGSISMYLKLDNGNGNPLKYNKSKYEVKDLLQIMDIKGNRPGGTQYGTGAFFFIDATGEVKEDGTDGYKYDATKKIGTGDAGHGVNLGSLSFQVDPEHITEMVTKFSDFIPGTGTGKDFLIGFKDGKENPDSWMLSEIILNPKSNPKNPAYVQNVRKPEGQTTKPNQGPWGDVAVGDKDNVNKWGQVVFEFIFPKVLVKADVAGGDDLVVNAYQAYGTGTLSDIAATVQRYRPEITGTYADASQENFIMKWGETKDGYKVYRPCKDGETPDYIECNECAKEIDQWAKYAPTDTDYKAVHDTHTSHTGWKEVTAAEYTTDKMYKGNREYMVVQNFYYTDQDQPELKKFPIPMRVHLTVTPVKLVDVNASKLTATYTQEQAKAFNKTTLADIDLPNEAILTLSPIPGPITLTMPISSWTPNTVGGLKTNDATPVPWPAASSTDLPAAGTYPLKGPSKEDIIKYTEKNYPWVTTTGFDKSIDATRIVTGGTVEDAIEYIPSYLKTGTDGRLFLDIKKQKKDGTAQNFQAGSDFRVYLPNGALIEKTTGTGLPNVAFGASTMGQNGVADSTKEMANEIAHLTFYPGSPTAQLPNWAGRSSHQEDVARAINLGGWFYVSVSEDSGSWSDMQAVYVPPRTNFYEESTGSYYNNDGAASGDSYYNFDFTGLYAGLYPFYSNTILPTNVVLPVGYTVTTTYDGLTGIEPGQLGEFRVEKWAAAQRTDPTATPVTIDPTHTAPTWDSGAVVEHGDPGPAVTPPATPAAAPLSPTDFADAVYNGYGAVEDHDPSAGTNADYTPHSWATPHPTPAREQVHMRVQAPDYVPSTPSVSPTPTATPDPSATPSVTPSPTPEPVDKPKESIRLIHKDSSYPADYVGGITRSPNNANGEVSKVTYTVQSEGYIARQTYTLTIVNNGDTDIYGLSIDVLSGVHKPANDGYSNHFEIIKPPASYIKAGGETDFVITYVFNLKDTDPTAKGTTYEDQILITSNGYDAANPLKQFIANFEVTGEDTYKVTVTTEPDPSVPGNIDMGSAKVIVGPKTQPTVPSPAPADNTITGAEKPSRSAATDTYPAGTKYVWIGAEPNDEYQVKEVYYIDGYDASDKPIKKPLYIHKYTPTPSTGSDTDVTYFFEMPPKDVTVVVVFYEPVFAKLRLSRILGFAGTKDDADLGLASTTKQDLIGFGKPIGTAVTDLEKWEHTMRHNVRWYDTTTNIIQTNANYQDMVCPTCGHTAPKEKFLLDATNMVNPTYVLCPDASCSSNTAGNGFDPQTAKTINNMTPDDSSRPKRPDYVMVLGDYANTPNAGENAGDLVRAQLDVRLRGNTLAPTIDKVKVQFFDYDVATGTRGSPMNSDPAADPAAGVTWVGASPTAGAPSSHRTEVFEVPLSEKGEVVTEAVEIVLTCTITQDMVDADPSIPAADVGQPISRSFVVVITRAGKTADVEFNYGNSPKGMIYNDSKKATDADKAAAWKAFIDNNNAFASGNTPSKATELTNTYWLEAWGDAWSNKNTYNGDRDEYALFVILGESFQDPGFAKLKNTIGLDVATKDIVRTAEVELLDITATKQADRFNGQRTPATNTSVDTVTLSLGTGDKGLVTGKSDDVIKDWWKKLDEDGKVLDEYAIRPGVYKLIYEFPDYDGKTLSAERYFIVLSPVGDVNADRAVKLTGVDSDVTYLKNRISDPLGGMPPKTVSGVTKPDYPDWRLFRYRCCDTNNDRNINNIDANQLSNGKSLVVRYYKPTDYVSK